MADDNGRLPNLGPQRVMQLGPEASVCPECGHPSFAMICINEATPQKILSLDKVQGQIKPVEGFKLCFYCLRREWYVVEGVKWQIVESFPGIIPAKEETPK